MLTTVGNICFVKLHFVVFFCENTSNCKHISVSLVIQMMLKCQLAFIAHLLFTLLQLGCC